MSLRWLWRRHFFSCKVLTTVRHTFSRRYNAAMTFSSQEHPCRRHTLAKLTRRFAAADHRLTTQRTRGPLVPLTQAQGQTSYSRIRQSGGHTSDPLETRHSGLGRADQHLAALSRDRPQTRKMHARSRGVSSRGEGLRWFDIGGRGTLNRVEDDPSMYTAKPRTSGTHSDNDGPQGRPGVLVQTSECMRTYWHPGHDMHADYGENSAAYFPQLDDPLALSRPS